MFTDSDIISSCSREDAIADGIFIDVTLQAKTRGFKIPVAITTSLFCEYIKKDRQDEDIDLDTDLLLKAFLNNVHKQIVNHPDRDKDSLLCLKAVNPVTPYNLIDVFVAIEPCSFTDPRPAITIMLPEDR